MEKLDPIEAAKKIRADLSGELDADLEEAMGDSGEKDADLGVEKGEEITKMKLSDEQTEALLKEGAEIEKKKKMEEVELSDSHPAAETLSLEALSEELKKAREEYIRKDYDMDKKANKFLKAFGLGRAGLGEYEKEIENYKNSYEEALKNYKDAVIDSEHVGDKEDVEIATRGFVIGENLNRESIRADLEAGEKGWSKTLMKGFNGLTEKYRKLSFKKKLLIGASVASVGIASSAIGGAAAIGGGGLITGYKLLSWSVSSTGFSNMFETIAQKGKGKKAEKEVENIKNSRFEGLESGMESSYEKLKEALDKNIEKVNSDIQKEKQWKVWRKYMGAGAGIGMSIMGRYLGKEIAEHFSGEAPEVSDGAAVESGVNSEAIKEQIEQALHNPEVDTLGETAAGVEAAEVVSGSEFPKGVTMDVAKGSSLEGTLKTFLAANSEKLTEGNMGWDTDKYSSVEEWAGKRAHIIAEEYAEDHADQFPKGAPSLIHPGAEINLDLSNPADIQIDNINDPEGLGYLEDRVGEKAPEVASAKTVEAAAETTIRQTEASVSEAPKMEAPVETMSAVEMQNQQLVEIKIAHALGLNPNEYSAINDTNVGKLLSEMDKFQELGAKKYIPDLPHHGIYGNPERYDHARLAEFIKSQLNNVPEGDRLSVKEFLMKVDLESLPKDSVIITKDVNPMYLVEVLRQETAETIKICANNNIEDWNNIKNVPVADSGFNKIVENIRMAVLKVLPEDIAAPSKGDTVEGWMTRITNEAYKRGTLDDLREQLVASRKL